MMGKRLSLLAVISGAIALNACAYMGVQVSSPFAQQMGVNFRGISIVVANGTPLYGRLVVYDKEIGTLGPGDVIYDERHWEPLQPEIPVLVILYGDPAMRHYIGMAARSLRLSQYESAVEWTIRQSDVRTLNGERLPELQRETALLSTRRPFPREARNSSSAIQIGNNTNYSCAVRVNGINRTVLNTGDVYPASARNFGFYSRELFIQLLFTDRNNNLIGTAERRVYVPTNAALAFQWIVNSYDIREQY